MGFDCFCLQLLQEISEKDLTRRLQRLWSKLRMQPIRFFCFHHVCHQFAPDRMNQLDWMDIDEFKRKINIQIREGVRFISMTESVKHIKRDFFRNKQYAVLTFDDGYASLKEILPWLKEQNIPVTLFINSDYSDGKAFRDTEKEQYLSRKELSELDVEIGMHGMRHLDVSVMDEREFDEFAIATISNTSTINGYVPFWAYTWGRHSSMTDSILHKKGIIPVYMDGLKNYNDATCIHRELLY